MNVITATNKDLLTPNSPRNREMMTRQIRVLRTLYQQFPDIIIGGGMAWNAMHRVGARDIDIFCISNDTALAVRSFLRGEEVSARLQYPCEVFNFSRSQDTEQGPYSAQFNKYVYKFMGCPPDQRGVAYEFNVIVRRTPPGTEVLFREQLAALYMMTVPYAYQGVCYTERGGNLRILVPFGSVGGVYSYGKDKQSYDKLVTKTLLLATGRRTLTGKENFGVHRLDLNGVPFGEPRAPLLNTYHAAYLFRWTCCVLRGYIQHTLAVSKSSGITTERVIEPVYVVKDTTLAELYRSNASYEQIRDASTAEALAGLPDSDLSKKRYLEKLRTRDWIGLYLSNMLDQYRSHISRSLGSRSQDWLNTFGYTPAVQPSGGANQVLPEQVAEDDTITSGVTTPPSRLFGAGTVSSAASQVRASFIRRTLGTWPS